MQNSTEIDNIAGTDGVMIDANPRPTIEQENQGALTTQSGRVLIPTVRMQESLAQQGRGIVSLFVEWEVFHDESYEIQDQLENPIAFVASTNPDVMYIDQAMKEHDKPELHTY